MSRPGHGLGSAANLVDGRVREHVDSVMAALWKHSGRRAHTPGGASWLYVQQVPVRRLVTQLVRKLLESHEKSVPPGYADSMASLPGEGLVGLRESSSREYRHYTVTASGVAFALGAPDPCGLSSSSGPFEAAHGKPLSTAPATGARPRLSTRPVLALSWSSRHAETLLPVLEELSRRGTPSVLVDLATDVADHCPEPKDPSITVCVAPPDVLAASGTVPGLWPVVEPFGENEAVKVGPHTVELRRLGGIAASLLERGGGCTQPSWAAAVAIEAWLDDLFAEVGPDHVLVANDTSPLGAIAVHAAERRGAMTILIQHGAWASVAVEALHSRRIVVMGERDAAAARAWAHHPSAEIHVLGQPRFDSLDLLDLDTQRAYLRQLLGTGEGRQPERIAVWACQPFGPERIRVQANLIADGVRHAKQPWGLVIAPHPAQDRKVFDGLLRGFETLTCAVADPRIGARGCLAGADAVLSVSSTCGIEAILLDVPVVEMHLPGERTLGLAEHGAAFAAQTAADVTVALDHVVADGSRVPPEARDAVCVRRGSSAAAIARLVVEPAATGAPHIPTYETTTLPTPGPAQRGDEGDAPR